MEKSGTEDLFDSKDGEAQEERNNSNTLAMPNILTSLNAQTTDTLCPMKNAVTVRGKGKVYGGGRGRGRGAKRRGNSRSSEPADMKKGHDSVTARVLSASRNKINELRNKVEEMKIQIRDLEQENKLYKRMQFRQEKAIKQIEEKENDLPSILEKHNNEIRSLREQNRKLKEKFDKSDRYLRDAEDELERVKKKMNKYKEMCEEKELMQRDELSRKLTKAELDVEEKDMKIKELTRHLEALKKNHRHELGIEVARQKDMKKQLDELSEKNLQLENQLKDKERALEMKNIYSNRPTHSSMDNSPDNSPSRKPKKKATSLTELTPRDKAKFYAEKRRAEVMKQKELKAEQERKKRKQWEEEMKEKDATSPSEESYYNPDREVEEDKSRREEEDKKWRDRENREKQEKEELERKKKELEKRQLHENNKKKEEKERKEREENERKDKEEKERRKQEEKSRLAKEEQERQRLEKEKREAEKAEQERKLQMEKERLENDPMLIEERRKKDELLRKLNSMNEQSNDPFTPASPVMKPKDNFQNGSGLSSPTKRGDPKEYSFTKPINNLHKGKPAHEDVSVPYLQHQKRRPSNDSAGYQPSFGPPKIGGNTKTKQPSLFDDDDSPFKPVSTSNSTTKADKKSTNLLENLFGPQATATKTSKHTDDPFLLSDSPNNKVEKTSSNTTFPWDAPPKNSKSNKSVFESEKKTALYGGGAAIVDDDVASTNKVLPKRQRQQNVNTFSSKPSVTAVSNFDDEIEEVVL
ncbi:lebercilin-like isoform X2 [Physella acuta]|uniref:lebercilin-like isoform X2 n=1 Tax=Physella acuta TaxID=109671 RepID=UPI0027DBCB6B|nr:lebercilin-like isoform X2 [Physella acuta]